MIASKVLLPKCIHYRIPCLSPIHSPNVSTTPITAMGRKPHCRNGVVDTLGHSTTLHHQSISRSKYGNDFLLKLKIKICQKIEPSLAARKPNRFNFSACILFLIGYFKTDMSHCVLSWAFLFSIWETFTSRQKSSKKAISITIHIWELFTILVELFRLKSKNK